MKGYLVLCRGTYYGVAIFAFVLHTMLMCSEISCYRANIETSSFQVSRIKLNHACGKEADIKIKGLIVILF